MKLMYGSLRDLVLFVQFIKREKHPWRSVNFSKPATLLELALLHGCFSRFLNCTNVTKSHNAPHLKFKLKIFSAKMCRSVVSNYDQIYTFIRKVRKRKNIKKYYMKNFDLKAKCSNTFEKKK